MEHAHTFQSFSASTDNLFIEAKLQVSPYFDRPLE